MIVLVLGTPGSGKSQKAEVLVMNMSLESERIYLATMAPYGKEGLERVKRHRKMREGKGFITIEKESRIHEILQEYDMDFSGKTCLLECMSNLVGNEMHLEENKGLSEEELSEKIVNSVLKIAEKVKNLVIVSNSFEKDDSFDEETIRYISLANRVNEDLKRKMDSIYTLIEGKWILSENN